MSSTHHATAVRRTAIGTMIYEVARPLRATGWTQWRAERRCRKTTGHCWHPEGFIDWWCCMCSGEASGMPAHKCAVCLGAEVSR
jgi:hypothetical protein